jgi:SAM-dependent methyltransferase
MARRNRGRTPEQFRILDMGSGNGRIVCGLGPEGFRVAVDASHPMLVELGARGDAVNPIQASLLTGALPFRPEIFDVVTSFRLIRHLSFPARSAIYRTIAELLRPGGVFIFDCPDRASEIAIRKIQGWGQYPIYDVFWSEDAIDQEMGASPMVVVEKRGIGRAALHGIRGALGERPVRWVVVCRKP